MRTVALAFSVALCAAPAFACKEPNDQAKRRGDLQLVLKRIYDNANLIEAVPPDIAAYIDKESDDALLSQNQSRFNLVANHKFYYAHQFHKQFDSFKISVSRAVNSYQVSEEIKGLARAASDSVSMLDAFEEYAQFDRRRRNRFLSDEQENETTFSIGLGKIRLLDALDCAVKQMREP